MIGKRTEENLPRRESGHVENDDELPVVFARDPQCRTDLRQRRQHDVDRQRRQRHERRRQADEFDKRNLQRDRRPFIPRSQHPLFAVYGVHSTSLKSRAELACARLCYILRQRQNAAVSTRDWGLIRPDITPLQRYCTVDFEFFEVPQ
jgi:hypothetical protein